MSPVIRAEGLVKRLSGEVPVTLVDNVNLEINCGEFVAIAGPSGSGKSSLLYLLGLLDRPTAGAIYLNDRNTSAYTQDEFAQARLSELGFVFQSHFLLPEFTALENVMLPMRRLNKLSPTEIESRAAELLKDLGLGEKLTKLPKQLSGGQCQRVAIARALANNPLLILADEPTGNLDKTSSANVQEILKGLAHQGQHAVVAVTHDVHFAQMADRIITIVDGKIAPA